MSIESLFRIPDRLDNNQRNWLEVCAAVPGAKEAFGDLPSQEDAALTQEAKSILQRRSSGEDRA